MSRKLERAAAIAVVATMVFTVSGAFAQDPVLGAENGHEAAGSPSVSQGIAQEIAGQDIVQGAIRFVSREVVQPLPVETAPAEYAADEPEGSPASTLHALVEAMPVSGELSRDMHCLAGAIYFEARGEPLLGQLAVGRVVIERASSDRFPSSYCGVVYQPSQFSFVRRGSMPAIDTASPAWRNAQAIAKIAHEDLWESPAKGALFFHATSVKPGWRLTRVGRVSSHVFYR